MKKLLLLGGSAYIVPVIKKAKELGIFTITCDYLPDNTAHKYSDRYVNVSVIDKERVLEISKELQIDGIMSFACDPGVVTAAYVAEKMNLPFQGSYESVKILQNKGLFRKFLIDNGFNCPHAKSYSDINAPYKDIDYFNWPVIVKPCDSAGSKGVKKADNPEDLNDAILYALENSISKTFIIEDFITRKGFHSTSDIFTIDGQIKFVTYSDEYEDPKSDNPFVPSRDVYPTTMDIENQNNLTSELQRLMKLLNMKDGIYNVDACVGINNIPYIMELSPRGGGAKVAEIQDMAYGVDLIKREIQKAVGLPIDDFDDYECNGVWTLMNIHLKSHEGGILKEIYIDPIIKEKHIRLIDIFVKQGDYIHPYTGENMSLGDIFLRFDTREELEKTVALEDEWLKVVLE